MDAERAHADLAEKRAAYASRLEEAVRRLVETLSAVDAVRRVSLFGSYARGRRDLFTDLDVLVVMDTTTGFLERLRFLYGILALPVDLDLVSYTPQELRELRDSPFLRRILDEEVVVYEKKPA
ncbi:MAG: nucleotidyltransferase domain-containing protein [Gemmatimonadota bacterium]